MMEEQSSQATLSHGSANIQIVHQAEHKEEIYLFKLTEDAEVVASKLSQQEQTQKTIAVISRDDDEFAISVIQDNATDYGKIIFICDDNNFKKEDISRLSLLVDVSLYESSGYKSVRGFNHIDSCRENLFSVIANDIRENGEALLWKKIYITHGQAEYLLLDERDIKYIFYKNMFIKIWKEVRGGMSRMCFKILANYSAKIIQTREFLDCDVLQSKEFVIEVLNFKGEKSIQSFSTDDMFALSTFSKKLLSMGNFRDCMSKSDFMQMLDLLSVTNEIENEQICKRPGRRVEQKVWIWDDAQMELED